MFCISKDYHWDLKFYLNYKHLSYSFGADIDFAALDGNTAMSIAQQYHQTNVLARLKQTRYCPFGNRSVQLGNVQHPIRTFQKFQSHIKYEQETNKSSGSIEQV